MTLNIVSKKMIKPLTPTPHNLKNYQISFSDHFMPPMNVPIVLFYQKSTKMDDYFLLDHLRQSLSKILPQFYPLAGRYVRGDHLVHCNDEGVEFVEAKYASYLSIEEYVQSGAHENPNDLLVPRPSCEVDEATDPLVAIQATKFDRGGGLALGISVSHRIFDAESITTFILAWAEEAAKNPRRAVINPSFDSPTLLPFKNLFPHSSQNPNKLPRTLNPDIIARRFVFDEGTISTLKERVRGRSMITRVGVVCALISKAMIQLNGTISSFLIGQVVNIRNRTVPPLPKHSCGNLIAMSPLKLTRPSNVGFEDLVSLLRGAVDRTIADCEGAFSSDEGPSTLYGPSMEVVRALMNVDSADCTLLSLTDWSKFDYYQADFGWGKPFWVGVATLPVSNAAVLMGSKGGDAIEAWVHLLREDVPLFEQELGGLLNKLLE